MPHTYNLRTLEQRVKLNIDKDIDIDKDMNNDIVNISLKLLNGKQYQLQINRDAKLDELYKLVSEKTYINSSDFYFVKQNRIMPKLEEIESWMTIQDFNFGNNITMTTTATPIDIKLHFSTKVRW